MQYHVAPARRGPASIDGIGESAREQPLPWSSGSAARGGGHRLRDLDRPSPGGRCPGTAARRWPPRYCRPMTAHHPRSTYRSPGGPHRPPSVHRDAHERGAPQGTSSRQRLPDRRPVGLLVCEQLRRTPMARSHPHGRRLLRAARDAAGGRRVGHDPLRDSERAGLRLRHRCRRRLRQSRQCAGRLGLRLLLRAPRSDPRRHRSTGDEGSSHRHRRPDRQRVLQHAAPALRGEVRRERSAVRSESVLTRWRTAGAPDIGVADEHRGERCRVRLLGSGPRRPVRLRVRPSDPTAGLAGRAGRAHPGLVRAAATRRRQTRTRRHPGPGARRRSTTAGPISPRGRCTSPAPHGPT